MRLTSQSDQPLRDVLGACYFQQTQDARNIFDLGVLSTGVEFDAAPRPMVCANVVTGFKAGGGIDGYAPEHLTGCTIGVGSRFP